MSNRGALTTTESIWRKPIWTEIEGKTVEAFCLDAGGMLVHRDGKSGRASALIPYASEAWTVDGLVIKSLVGEITKKLSVSFHGTGHSHLYQNGLPRVPELYARPTSHHEDEELLKSAIKAFEGADEDLREEIQAELENVGVYPFFSIEGLGASYFTSIGGSLKRESVISAGWVNSDSVFVKAKIA